MCRWQSYVISVTSQLRWMRFNASEYSSDAYWQDHAYGLRGAAESTCFVGPQVCALMWGTGSCLAQQPPAHNSFLSHSAHSSCEPVMASVASQLVLHPVTSQSIKLLNTTNGRDKV